MGIVLCGIFGAVLIRVHRRNDDASVTIDDPNAISKTSITCISVFHDFQRVPGFPRAVSDGRPVLGPLRRFNGHRGQESASIPLRRMTFSSFSDGPLGRFSPISHF